MATYKHIESTRSVLYRFLHIFRPALNKRLSRIAVYVVFCYIGIAVVGPYLPIAGPYEIQKTAAGAVVKSSPPTLAHPFGTTSLGYSVLSQVIYSFRTSLIIGLLTSTIVVFIGLNIGLIAGYFGGWVDSMLMSLTDIIYGLPLLPFAIVFVSIIGRGTLQMSLIVGVILWRTIARITRSETLSLKEREYVKSARAVGTTDVKIMYNHILPNLLPIIAVYFVFATTWGILVEASLSFIGLGDPNSISWGIMLHTAFFQAQFTSAWWWVIPPSICLWLFIFSLFIIARKLEDNIDEPARRA